MEKFTTLTAIAAPMMMPNIDTDIIIPMDRMVTAERSDMHKHAFEPWRFLKGGSKNPDFILNQAPYTKAKILVVGSNFGCGSSREGAVWALKGLGVRCLIGSSFGTIFYNNCFQNGILPIALPAEHVDEIAKQISASDNAAVITVDLENRTVSPSIGAVLSFEIDDVKRQQLLSGVDDITLTLQRAGEIDAFRDADKRERPWIYA